ncbi:hypothetical protein D9757_003575 [Collybiopsis confluens]|uniref:Uncharacterized protein n=1 Tax=Collybiopsis confluens TaxID=2823264 RepID=A0A8H5HVD4_9AGAR|nr:hypothetical protein D9757_003575 [Collybiopsis confluens]
MSISIAIVPLQKSLHMFGDPDRSSAYSLSGHVAIKLSSQFLSRKFSKVLLQSLELVLEGQSEVSTPDIGYSAIRLCSSTTELVTSGPILLSGDGDECLSEPCQWNVTYNINVPGWLPETTSFGHEGTGVSYRLFATAKYVDIEKYSRDTSSTTPWLLSRGHHSALLWFTQRRAEARPTVTYLLKHITAQEPKSDIPSDVMSKIQILASVAKYTDIEDGKVSLTLRLRTNNLAAEECQRLQLLGFRVDVQQSDKCRLEPSPQYEMRYPLPGKEFQPPHLPLRYTKRSGFMMSEYPNGGHNASCSRSFSLLHPSEAGQYNLQNDNYIFANDAKPTSQPAWYTLQTNIPIVNCAAPTSMYEWAGPPVLRPSTTGPLITVRHEILISLPLAYDVPGSDQKAQESLVFTVPIRFGSEAPQSKRCSSSFSSRPSTPVEMGNDSDLSFESTNSPILPPYSQFYHPNGDRKIDPTPLPLYTPPGVPAVEHLDVPIQGRARPRAGTVVAFSSRKERSAAAAA